MRQQTVTKEQLSKLAARLGRQNSQFTRDPLNEYKGGSIEGLMVTDPNYGVVCYNASFPCQIVRHVDGKRYESNSSIAHWTVLETGWMAAIGIGCPSASLLNAFLPQYPQGPQQFAQALQSVTRIKINWHFVNLPLTTNDPGLVYEGVGQQLRVPAKNNGHPSELVVHQSTLIRLKNEGRATFGTGQRAWTRTAVLVSMYHPGTRVPARIERIEAMSGWFRYHVTRVQL